MPQPRLPHSLLAGAVLLCGCTAEQAEAPADLGSADPSTMGETPSLTSMEPRVASNAGGTLVTLQGQNFSSKTLVLIGGKLATAVSVLSGTQILATVPENLKVRGKTDVLLLNPSGQRSLRSDLFSYSVAEPYFQQQGSSLALGAGPYALATGDVSQDGKTDLAVANRGGSSVILALSKGTLGFAPAKTVMTPQSVQAVALADLNGVSA